MKKWLAGALLLATFTTQAQRSIEGLIQAERNFADYASKNGIKKAFLKYIDSNAIDFEGGKIVNGLQLWQKREDGPGLLKWHPQFAEIASSNDLGYTTGPWTLQKTEQDSIIARGQYNTVWHVDRNGEWKFLIDLGTRYNLENTSTEVRTIDAPKIKEYPLNLLAMVKAEEAFIKAYNKDPKAAYKQIISEQSIINRNRYLPAFDQADRDKIVEATPSNIKFTINGSGIASSGDFGYVYGTTELNGKIDNYLHVYRKENEGWKIALEVLHH